VSDHRQPPAPHDPEFEALMRDLDEPRDPIRVLVLDEVPRTLDSYYVEQVFRTAVDVTTALLKSYVEHRNYPLEVALRGGPGPHPSLFIEPVLDEELTRAIESGQHARVPAIGFPEAAIVEALYRDAGGAFNKDLNITHHAAQGMSMASFYAFVLAKVRRSTMFGFLTAIADATATHDIATAGKVAHNFHQFLQARSQHYGMALGIVNDEGYMRLGEIDPDDLNDLGPNFGAN
jgi:hypothetical protein